MGLIMEVCDRIVVLNFGEKIAEGKPEKFSETRQSLKPTWAGCIDATH